MHQVSAELVPKLLYEDQRIQIQFVRISCNEQMMKTFLKLSSLKTRVGFTGMALKQNDCHHYGRALICHATKNHYNVLKRENNGDLFFHYHSTDYHELIPVGQTVNQALLYGNSRACEGCGTKKMTGNVDCKNMGNSSQHANSHSIVNSRVLAKALDSCPSKTPLFA
jgi:hypothetical protein